jgi:hypothetical protein
MEESQLIQLKFENSVELIGAILKIENTIDSIVDNDTNTTLLQLSGDELKAFKASLENKSDEEVESLFITQKIEVLNSNKVYKMLPLLDPSKTSPTQDELNKAYESLKIVSDDIMDILETDNIRTILKDMQEYMDENGSSSNSSDGDYAKIVDAVNKFVGESKSEKHNKNIFHMNACPLAIELDEPNDEGVSPISDLRKAKRVNEINGEETDVDYDAEIEELVNDRKREYFHNFFGLNAVGANAFDIAAFDPLDYDVATGSSYLVTLDSVADLLTEDNKKALGCCVLHALLKEALGDTPKYNAAKADEEESADDSERILPSGPSSDESGEVVEGNSSSGSGTNKGED